MKGMILGAGLGTRLRPLTFELPKPAIPVLGRPLISYNMEFLNKLGIRDLVINLHRIPGIIKNRINKWGGFKGKISYIIEPDILGTGGGIKNATRFLNKEKFFIIANSDTILDFNLKEAIKFHVSEQAFATMVLFPPRDDTYPCIYLDENFNLITIRKKPDSFDHRGFYTGASILSSEILDILPEGKSCIIQDGIIPARNNGLRVMGFMTEGLFLEFGTPWDYLKNTIQFMDLYGRSEGKYGNDITIIAPVCIGDNAILGDNTTIGPYASIESGAVIKEGATVKRTIVWEKGTVEKNSVIEYSVVTPRRVVRCSPERANT